MKYRDLGNSGQLVSEIGLGCWQLGADWGSVSESQAIEILSAAVESGVTFFDTADVYGDGRSERLIGDFLSDLESEIFVATKVGRKNYPGPYSKDGLRTHIQQGRDRLGREAVDLLQLHCLPTEVMRERSVFSWLRDFRKEGLIKNFGASVETIDEALMILDEPELTSLQIIFNVFRQKPIEELFDKASEAGVGIVVRLPLASGLLSGKFNKDTTFAQDDHRNYNSNGESFNVGETFAGLALDVGVELVDRIAPHVPHGMAMAQFCQRWILDHPAVTTVITGASSAVQASDNAASSSFAPLDKEVHKALRDLYESSVKNHIRGVY